MTARRFEISRAIFDAMASIFDFSKKHIDEENDQAIEIVEFVLQEEFGIQDPIEVVSLYYYNYTSAKMDILVELTQADGSVVTERYYFDTEGRPLTPPIGAEFCESGSDDDESDDDDDESDSDDDDYERHLQQMIRFEL